MRDGGMKSKAGTITCSVDESKYEREREGGIKGG